MKTKSLIVKIDPDLKQKFKAAVYADGDSIRTVVERFVVEYVEKAEASHERLPNQRAA